MPDLILRPSGLADKPFSLQLRWHDGLGETAFQTLARVTETTAREIIKAGGAFWLFGDPAERETTPHDLGD